MDKPRSASDKIRPFLEAMERSISQVRRQRLQDSGEVSADTNGQRSAPGQLGSSGTPGATAPGRSAPYAAPARPAPYPAPARPVPSRDDAVIGGTPPPRPSQAPYQAPGQRPGETPDKPQRLKARPKRPSTYSNTGLDDDRYRSQTG